MADNSELVQAQVVRFLAEITGTEPEAIMPDTLVNQELGVDGDDAMELLSAYAREFSVDISQLDYHAYFGPEQGATFGTLLIWLTQMLGLRPLYSTRPLPVAYLVQAACTGVWQDSISSKPRADVL